jgi:putative endonuclease
MALSKRSASKGSVENPGYLSTIPKMDLVEQARQIAPTVTESNAVVYILRLASGAFYVGSTLNLPQRMADHVAGIGCKTTRNDPPLLLLLVEPHPTFSAARKREAQIKRWSRAKKEAFVTRDMEALKQLSKSRESVN